MTRFCIFLMNRKNEMERILEILNSHIQKLRPEFYSNLNAPLDDHDIQHFERKYNIQIPEDLKILYLWKSGQESSCYEVFVNNSMFIPLEEALEIAQELTGMIGTDFEMENWWNENWIPVFHNGGGSYICYDLRGIFTGNIGQILQFWKRDNDRNVIASSLTHFLNQLSRYYEEQSGEFDEFFTVEYEKCFPKRFNAR